MTKEPSPLSVEEIDNNGTFFIPIIADEDEDEFLDEMFIFVDDMDPREKLTLARSLSGDDFFCRKLFFSLIYDSPKLVQIQSDFPELQVTFQLENSFLVSLPPKGEVLDAFIELYGDLPQPEPEHKEALKALYRSKVRN